MLFRKKDKNLESKIDFDRLPQHIAFIMDGNGRWAKKRGRLRTFGHKVGAESMDAVVRHARDLGIKVVSFFAFSTENWNRPREEVGEIFSIARKLIVEKKESFLKSNMRVIVIGDRKRLPEDLQKEIEDCERVTKDNDGLIVNVALNYGGRAEIIGAINRIIKDGVKEVNEEIFKSYLQTSNIPDPDLVIRTSGEQRLSNFMMYQCAYSELYFPKVHWPDFREKQLDEAIIEFQKRDRRFGAIKK